jgi:hypothetical protein
MSNCFLCEKPDAEREAIIELLKPQQPRQTGVAFQMNPSPDWRAKVAICSTCFNKVRLLPLEHGHRWT